MASRQSRQPRELHIHESLDQLLAAVQLIEAKVPVQPQQLEVLNPAVTVHVIHIEEETGHACRLLHLKRATLPAHVNVPRL